MIDLEDTPDNRRDPLEHIRKLLEERAQQQMREDMVFLDFKVGQEQMRRFKSEVELVAQQRHAYVIVETPKESAITPEQRYLYQSLANETVEILKLEDDALFKAAAQPLLLSLLYLLDDIMKTPLS